MSAGCTIAVVRQADVHQHEEARTLVAASILGELLRFRVRSPSAIGQARSRASQSRRRAVAHGENLGRSTR